MNMEVLRARSNTGRLENNRGTKAIQILHLVIVGQTFHYKPLKRYFFVTAIANSLILFDDAVVNSVVLTVPY